MQANFKGYVILVREMFFSFFIRKYDVDKLRHTSQCYFSNQIANLLLLITNKKENEKKKGKIKKLFLIREVAERPSASQGVTDRPSEN